jgi:hypothetical protein
LWEKTLIKKNYINNTGIIHGKMEMWEFWDFDCPNQNFKILMSDVKIVRPFGGSQTPKSFWARARNLAKWLGKINWFGFGGNQMRVRDSSRKCLKNQMNFVFFYGFMIHDSCHMPFMHNITTILRSVSSRRRRRRR